jgi:hypothetical protein
MAKAFSTQLRDFLYRLNRSHLGQNIINIIYKFEMGYVLCTFGMYDLAFSRYRIFSY